MDIFFNGFTFFLLHYEIGIVSQADNIKLMLQSEMKGNKCGYAQLTTSL